MSDTTIGVANKRPSFFWLATEIGRAITERSFFIPFNKFYKADHIGDGHPVLVLPGFIASDISTSKLRLFINNLGYDALSWDLGRNHGKVETLELLSKRIEQIYTERQEKISIVGWSLGGIFARQLAKSHPEKIRQVITMGSPFRGITQPNNVSWLYNIISGGKRVVDLDPELLADIPKPAPVPTTAIYSKEDGVVPWEACTEAETDALHQNVQVHGSHLGMGVNPAVLKIIAQQLKYSKEDWKYFEPENYWDDLLFYPSC